MEPTPPTTTGTWGCMGSSDRLACTGSGSRLHSTRLWNHTTHVGYSTARLDTLLPSPACLPHCSADMTNNKLAEVIIRRNIKH
ncbi:hypothetical protein ACOSP7_022555 [Xanthoceras sorbifolium]